ncbi:hypothetical protein [Nocardia farcinica]|uniref:hypothetical protein n=1 Tax=Nocardia farcinica TaxID=37329 RepID=UPI0015F0B180|nr:hypothetical protein [Nocardia farcinica]MBA4858043.1 hypothetical protein [Nocardia farcinica]MBC9819426.1 hypothetical protein [Nocardia farcinica]
MTTAIGYIRQEHAGRDTDQLRALIEACAQRRGLDLAEIYIAELDEFMPLLVLLERMHTVHAQVVIAPTAEHIWSHRRAITEQAEMVIARPEQAWPHRHRWPLPDAVRTW